MNNSRDLEITFEFENQNFFIDYPSCQSSVSNLRTESELLAQALFSETPAIILGLSSGLDSQVVLHSFYSQNFKIKCAFMHLPGYNEVEFERVKLLEKKYNLDLEVVEIYPELCKDKLFNEFEETGIPPYQLLHKQFLSCLPADHSFIQGLDGPDFYQTNSAWNIIQTANSFVNSRTRAFYLLKRSGRIINWERHSKILLSILTDDIVSAFLYSYNNIVNNNLVYSSGKKIPIVDHYDLYIKPFIYAKYWKDELEYFPKYQGCEEIHWVMNNKWHRYKQNVAVIPLNDLVTHLQSSPYSAKRYYQR